MNYLEEYDFSKEEVSNLEKKIPKVLKGKLNEYKAIVGPNIEFLKNLGVPNYKEIFSHYYDMFLMDGSNFQEIFLKYDTEDLIEKLIKNMAIIEHL